MSNIKMLKFKEDCSMKSPIDPCFQVLPRVQILETENSNLVLVTETKESASLYDIKNQITLKSWLINPRLICPMIYDFKNSRFLMVQHKVIQSTTFNPLGHQEIICNIDTSILCVLATPENVLVVLSSGHIDILDKFVHDQRYHDSKTQLLNSKSKIHQIKVINSDPETSTIAFLINSKSSFVMKLFSFNHKTRNTKIISTLNIFFPFLSCTITNDGDFVAVMLNGDVIFKNNHGMEKVKGSIQMNEGFKVVNVFEISSAMIGVVKIDELEGTCTLTSIDTVNGPSAEQVFYHYITKNGIYVYEQTMIIITSSTIKCIDFEILQIELPPPSNSVVQCIQQSSRKRKLSQDEEEFGSSDRQVAEKLYFSTADDTSDLAPMGKSKKKKIKTRAIDKSSGNQLAIMPASISQFPSTEESGQDNSLPPMLEITGVSPIHVPESEDVSSIESTAKLETTPAHISPDPGQGNLSPKKSPSKFDSSSQGESQAANTEQEAQSSESSFVKPILKDSLYERLFNSTQNESSDTDKIPKSRRRRKRKSMANGVVESSSEQSQADAFIDSTNASRTLKFSTDESEAEPTQAQVGARVSKSLPSTTAVALEQLPTLNTLENLAKTSIKTYSKTRTKIPKTPQSKSPVETPTKSPVKTPTKSPEKNCEVTPSKPHKKKKKKKKKVNETNQKDVKVNKTPVVLSQSGKKIFSKFSLYDPIDTFASSDAPQAHNNKSPQKKSRT